MSFWKTSDEFPGSISLPYGIKTSHTWHEIGAILRVINDFDIETFVELGVHVGGLASILLPRNRYHNFVYFGIEQNENFVHPMLKEHIYIGDIMASVDIVSRVKMNRRTFIYCDGGNKIEEMRAYYPLLNSGDIIACHDFFDGQEVDGLKDFGFSDDCGCRPEVWRESLSFLFENYEFAPIFIPKTRIQGFIKT